jgi:ATP-dependent Lon protease
MLDEVDKLGSDFRGDPSSALLEVLDPEQNREFRDHYLEVAFDLSQVMFITTANWLDSIPPPLLDRMEVIQLAGYTENEKIAIATGYLIPRQIRENGLKPGEIAISEEAISEVIRSYTREAGVRNLERELGRLCRKVATRVAEGSTAHVDVGREQISELIGRAKFLGEEELMDRTEIPGVATGLAWTPTGGQVLYIEAAAVPGNREFVLTGSLGQVMQESARAALSYVQAKSDKLGVAPEFWKNHEIHLHIPAGGQPKDGPSAGITMAVALASLASNRPVRYNVGMTGEITLRGKVLPIGGLKEKILAAHRTGLDTVILPRRNEPDLEDVPEEIRKKMDFKLVDTVSDVFSIALEPPTDGRKGKKASVQSTRKTSTRKQGRATKRTPKAQPEAPGARR